MRNDQINNLSAHIQRDIGLSGLSENQTNANRNKRFLGDVKRAITDKFLPLKLVSFKNAWA